MKLVEYIKSYRKVRENLLKTGITTTFMERLMREILPVERPIREIHHSPTFLPPPCKEFPEYPDLFHLSPDPILFDLDYILR